MFGVFGRLNLYGTAVAAPICHGWVVSLMPYSSPIGALIHFSYEAVQLNTIALLALYEGEAPVFCWLRNFYRFTLTLTFNRHCRTLDHKIVASR